MDVLEIDNVELNFGLEEVLKAIYFKAEKGKITGILGSNGSGKTSLLRIIFGELKPNNKLIKIDKKPFLKPLYKKGIIKYLPQFNIIPDKSLKEIFYLFDVNISDFLNNFPEYNKKRDLHFIEFSGGEKRLLESYIMIKSPSRILLLDEPFSHIAPIYIEKLKELILEEKDKKIIIITDHLYKDILSISDNLYLIKDGWSRLIKNKEELIYHKYINSL